LNQKVVCSILALGVAAMAAAQTPAAAGAASAAKPVAAAGPAPTKIAVINITQAIANTKDGKKASAELQTKFNPRRSTLEKRQTDIQAMTEQLRRGSATMSDDAKAKMQRDIDTNTKSLQRDAQDLNDDADQEQSKIINEIGGKMMQVVDQYAIQNGFAVVLDVSNQQTPVIWASASTEITGDIVQLYDQAHPGTEAPAAARPPAAAKPPVVRPPAAPAGKKQ
jgi:outer membrane protein